MGTQVRVRFVALLLLAACLGAGCRASNRLPPGEPAPLKAPKIKPGNYRVTVGDELEIRVWQEDSLTTQQRILPDGTVAPILLDPVAVDGMTVPEIKAVLTEKYTDYLKEPKVSVRVATIFRAKLYVLGEVAAPGPVTYHGRTTLWEALGEAGGVNEAIADKSTIRIVRTLNLDCPQIYTVNGRDILTGCACNVEVTAGDILYVHPTQLADWSERFKQALAPFSDTLGTLGSVAATILAIEALND